jgi:hypothetical protein
LSVGEPYAFIAKHVIWKLLLLGMAALGFVTAGWMAASGRIGDAPAWFGWVSILFFGPCALVIFKLVFDRRPQIIIDTQGICYRRWSDDVILWDDISRLHFFSVGRNDMMGISLIDDTKYPGRGSLKWFAPLNRGLGFEGINVALTGMDKSMAQLAVGVAHFAPAHVERG